MTPAAEKMAEKPRKSVKTCKTLIVEDDEVAAGALVTVLSKKGFEVEIAGSVGDALVGLRWQPRCMILDLMLPDGNGVTVLRRVRKAQMPIRVAIVTAMHDPF